MCLTAWYGVARSLDTLKKGPARNVCVFITLFRVFSKLSFKQYVCFTLSMRSDRAPLAAAVRPFMISLTHPSTPEMCLTKHRGRPGGPGDTNNPERSSQNAKKISPIYPKLKEIRIF